MENNKNYDKFMLFVLFMNEFLNYFLRASFNETKMAAVVPKMQLYFIICVFFNFN